MTEHLHDLLEICLMSLAIGMDAFSLSMGLGLNGLRRDQALRLAAWIGVFHVGMTLAGLWAGAVLGSRLGYAAHVFGAALLIGMGLHMLYGSVSQQPEAMPFGRTLSSKLAFSAGVSVDALSVGFSLGLRSTAYGVMSALAFGWAATWMCLAGMYVGKKANAWAGAWGEVVGACILIGYGAHFLFG
ncbi:putative manganese efflux pump MntP [Alicyclobacillus cellulosilyticus]|uniref:Manganese efflux pump MntP n=1 Tax=Alicyclobacillus cellulosilyticus TaxID=1003997 RepID=A0A917K7X8_9BACL|nr:manganese efflux pump [Alicyclobacillus cellulosilyticus]GGJ02405.1 putative manganese efflux pump MntP [Alicyclobacillus cellulosilyticus]